MKILKEAFWSKVDIRSEDECWEWLASRDSGGYGHFRFKGKWQLAHRVAWVLTNGEIPPRKCVRHKECDNPPCCNPKHLRLGTDADNSHDMIEKGRQSRLKGEQNGTSKLTNEQVLMIRKEYATGNTSTCKLAKKYFVSQTTVWEIIHRKTWKHI